jgi:hypothetical protein
MNILEFKAEAKKLNEQKKCGRARAHEIVAKSLGYNSVNHLYAETEIINKNHMEMSI